MPAYIKVASNSLQVVKPPSIGPTVSLASTLMGLYDVLNSFSLLGTYSDALAGRARFKAEALSAQGTWYSAIPWIWFSV